MSINPKWLVFPVLAILSVYQTGSPSGGKGSSQAFVDITGVKHTPLDAKGAKAIVLFFMVTDCPVANYFAAEINAIVKDYEAKKVRFFIVHVDPDLTPDAAHQHAKEYGFTCPVLIDAKHHLVEATSATITPEAVVLTPDSKIAYRGRIDDRYVELGKRRIEPNRRDLREALTAVLAGQAVKEGRTRAIGCPIMDIAPEGKKNKMGSLNWGPRGRCQ